MTAPEGADVVVVVVVVVVAAVVAAALEGVELGVDMGQGGRRPPL